MPSSNPAREVVVHDGAVTQKADPLVWWLAVTVAFLIVTLLVGVLYALLNGVSSSRAPRTALEARLVILEKAVEDYPQSGDAWRDYISVLAAVGDFRKAEQTLGLARQQVKGFESGPVGVGELNMLWADKRHDDVIKRAGVIYKEQVDLRKKWEREMWAKNRKVAYSDVEPTVLVEILLLDARARGAKDDWEGSVERLTAALELDPQAADIMALRGSAYAQLKQYEKARADFKGALKYIPDFEPAIAGLNELKTKK